MQDGCCKVVWMIPQRTEAFHVCLLLMRRKIVAEPGQILCLPLSRLLHVLF